MDTACEGRWRLRGRAPATLLVWTPLLLIGPVQELAASGWPLASVAAVVAVAACDGAALALSRTDVDRHEVRWLVAAQAALTVLLALTAAGDWSGLFGLLTIACAGALPPRLAVPSTVASVLAYVALADWTSGALVATVLSGVTTFVFIRLCATIDELARTRTALAEAAVAQERIRMSRDLHDLLGQTLSLVVVKAEAVRRTVRSAPATAEEHAGDIERIGREALSQARDAITVRRPVDLVDEIARARGLCASADIAFDLEEPPPAVSGRAGSLLGSVLREGVTNVVRHADARRCRLRIGAGPGSVRLDLVDDGRSAPGAVPGTGLEGLRRRVGEAGGTFGYGATDEGFSLWAELPVEREPVS